MDEKSTVRLRVDEKKLRSLMKERGFQNFRQLAKAANLHAIQLQAWITSGGFADDDALSAFFLLRLAGTLNCKLDELTEEIVVKPVAREVRWRVDEGKLRRRMKVCGFKSFRALAQAAGIHYNTLTKWVKSDNFMSDDFALLAVPLNCYPWELTTMENFPLSQLGMATETYAP